MLQQTQIARVLPKYREFLAAFPDPRSFADSSLRKALALWQGLGYNRRCLYLHRAAREIVQRFGGKVPRTIEELASLPGVGPYTARAVAVFAYGLPVALIETNVRRVFLHTFFAEAKVVSDAQILPLVDQTMDRRDPRGWFNALMDYGAELAEEGTNANRRSRHYARQSRFEGSTRQLRGRVLALVVARGAASKGSIARDARAAAPRVDEALEALVREGFLRLQKGRYKPA